MRPHITEDEDTGSGEMSPSQLDCLRHIHGPVPTTQHLLGKTLVCVCVCTYAGGVGVGRNGGEEVRYPKKTIFK